MVGRQLSEKQKARIEENRLKALQLRKSKLVSRPAPYDALGKKKGRYAEKIGIQFYLLSERAFSGFIQVFESFVICQHPFQDLKKS